MKTLKELVNFVGIPQGSLATARYGDPGPERTMGLETVNLLVTRRQKPASMRNIIQILQNLTPITLEAEIVGSRSGEEPFDPEFRVNAGGGITWFTTIEYNVLYGNTFSRDVDNSGGDFSPTQLGPGGYELFVKRAGISNTGFVSLRKPLGIITVSARPRPTPTPTPTPTPPPSTPIIGVELSITPGSFQNLGVTGSGFLAGEQVEVIKTTTSNDGINQTVSTDTNITVADGLGRINYSIGVACPVGISTTYGVRARGLRSGRLSNTAGAIC